MRKFDYRSDYGIIPTTIHGYVNQLRKELTLLKEMESDSVYDEYLQMIDDFIGKYPDLSVVSSAILSDLLLPVNVEYCYEHNFYPNNASRLGMEFEADLKKIIAVGLNLG